VKIAYLVGSFPHVSETFIVNQIAGMAARGHDVDVFTTVPGQESAVVPEIVRRLGLEARTHSLYGASGIGERFFRAAQLTLTDGWRTPGLILKALNVMRYRRAATTLGLLCAGLTMQRHQRKRHYDVIHCQFGTYGETALRLRDIGATSARIIVSFRGFDATKHLRLHPDRYQALFQRGDLFLPVSRSLAERLKAAGCAESKIVVHHSGIDCARFAYAARRRNAGEVTRALSIARLTEKKGIAFGIRAVASVMATGRRVSYAIVGDGPMREELQALIDSLGLSAHMQLLGWRPHEDVIRMMQSAHVLLAPSITASDGDEEGIPNVVKEAMATGLPVVSTTHGGIPELVQDGVSGYLVPQRDVEAMANRLARIVDDPGSCEAIGLAARRTVLDEFDIKRLNDDLEKLYEGIIRGPGMYAPETAGTCAPMTRSPTISDGP
jgi:colanic acid/amylovoran biosynthesis glycosyltransferase